MSTAPDVFPIFLKLEGKSCLIVGGGEAAWRKAELLLRAGAVLTVAAEHLSHGFESPVAAGRIRRVDGFSPELLAGQSLVIAATDDPDLAARVSAAAREAGVLVNVIDRPALSSFISGALVDRSPVLVAISTHGTAPVLAREIRFAIERILPPALGRLARFAGRFRSAVEAAVPAAISRRRFWENFFKGPVAARVLAGDESGAQVAMLALVNRPDGKREVAGMVHVLDGETNEADLLTMRALRVLGEADAVVFDGNAARALVDAGRRDAERIAITAGREQALARVAELASTGKRVVRLAPNAAAADAEVSDLLSRGVAAERIPGVGATPSAALPRADAVNA